MGDLFYFFTTVVAVLHGCCGSLVLWEGKFCLACRRFWCSLLLDGLVLRIGGVHVHGIVCLSCSLFVYIETCSCRAKREARKME